MISDAIRIVVVILPAPFPKVRCQAINSLIRPNERRDPRCRNFAQGRMDDGSYLCRRHADRHRSGGRVEISTTAYERKPYEWNRKYSYWAEVES